MATAVVNRHHFDDIANDAVIDHVREARDQRPSNVLKFDRSSFWKLADRFKCRFDFRQKFIAQALTFRFVPIT